MATGGDNRPVDEREPAIEYRDDPKDPDNWVLIKFDTPGLKKQFLKNKPSNGDIDLKPKLRGFKFVATIEGKEKKTIFRYDVEKLPGEIKPGECWCKMKKDNEVQVRLVKKEPSSWMRDFETTGLEFAGESS